MLHHLHGFGKGLVIATHGIHAVTHTADGHDFEETADGGQNRILEHLGTTDENHTLLHGIDGRDGILQGTGVVGCQDECTIGRDVLPTDDGVFSEAGSM